MQTHYFIALALPLEIKNELTTHYATISKAFPFKKPVHALDYHVTLAFLGAQDETKLHRLMEDIAAHTKDFASIPLTIDGYGTFGNITAPRIFWNRLKHKPALFELQQTIAEHCQTHGIELEARPYNPHITVARKWASETAFDRNALEQHNPLKAMPLTFTANEVVLYRTNVTATPKYEAIASIALKNHEPLL